MSVPPVAENATQVRQSSFTNAANEDIGFGNLPEIQGKNAFKDTLKPRPRRRLGDNLTDRADGLDVLIQKTKAIGLRAGESELAPNEDGNEWLDALRYKGERLLWGVTKIRKYVCGSGSDAHAEELIRYQVLERLLYFLDETTETDTLFEILWIITNIAAGPTAHTTSLVEKGFIIPLGQLLNHPKGNIRTQAAWAIGNIIGDREGYRDLVLEAGLLPLILNIWNGEGLDIDSKKESFRIALWIVDNMCRYKPDWHLMKPAFEIIPHVLQENEPAILKECCWAVARILHQSGRHSAIDSMITPAFCSRLIEIFRWGVSLTTHPILRALINLASSKNPMHLKYIVDAGLLSHLEEYLILIDSKNSFEIFAVQILGNLASHQEYSLKISGRQHICKWFIDNLVQGSTKELRNEICIALRNMVFHRCEAINGNLISADLLANLKHLLYASSAEKKGLLIILEVLHYIAQTNPVKIDQEFFPLLLSTYVNTSGVTVEEIDYHVDIQDDGADSDSDEEQARPQHPKNNFSFDISNPSHIYQAPIRNLKEKIANRAFDILRAVFSKDLNTAILNSQQDSYVCKALDEMGFDGNSNSKITNLADIFNQLSPTK